MFISSSRACTAGKTFVIDRFRFIRCVHARKASQAGYSTAVGRCVYACLVSCTSNMPALSERPLLGIYYSYIHTSFNALNRERSFPGTNAPLPEHAAHASIRLRHTDATHYESRSFPQLYVASNRLRRTMAVQWDGNQLIKISSTDSNIANRAASSRACRSRAGLRQQRRLPHGVCPGLFAHDKGPKWAGQSPFQSVEQRGGAPAINCLLVYFVRVHTGLSF